MPYSSYAETSAQALWFNKNYSCFGLKSYELPVVAGFHLVKAF
jgi:hypothetical protein